MIEKTCKKCFITKPIEEFNFKDKARGKRQAQCQICTREAIRNHYYKHVDYYHRKAQKRRKLLQVLLKQFLIDYLQTHPCVDCNEKDIIVLEFDHLRDKTREIGTFLQNGYPINTVKKEIEKCEVRCANCHKRKTAKEFGWYKYKYLNR